MEELTAALEALGERALGHLRAKSQAREQGLAQSRLAVRNAANAIRAAHRGDFDGARRLAAAARRAVEQARLALAEHPDILYAGFVHDAEKEFAEAAATIALLSGDGLPPPDELGVGYTAYLNGLGETVGELRRFLLDSLRRDETERAESALEAMEAIYAVLMLMDFPDAMTGGLRRTADAARGMIERSRGDLTLALCQARLERRLAAFGEPAGGGGTASG